MPDVTAAKVPVRLKNGDIVIVSPFTNRDLMTIFKFIQKCYLAKMVEAIPKDVSAEQYKAAYSEALRISKDFTIEKIGELIAELADIDIVSLVIRLAIQKDSNGDVSKKVDGIIDNQEDFNAVMSAINSLGAAKEEGDKALPPKTVQS